MTIKDIDGNYINVTLVISHYSRYNNCCFILHTTNGETYAVLTTNITQLPSDCITLDTNNIPEAIEFIETYQLAKPTGETIKSGFCEYPVYRINKDKCEPYFQNR